MITALKNNDRVTQEKVYKEYFKRWMLLCLRYVNNTDDAMIILNDGFMKIFTSIHTFDEKNSFEGWMRRIMVNTAIDFIRKQKIRIVELNMIPTQLQQVENISLSNYKAEEILQLIQQLPETTRLVFNLFAIEGFSHKEIAAQINMSESASAWHVNNARKILKEKLIVNSKKASSC